MINDATGDVLAGCFLQAAPAGDNAPDAAAAGADTEEAKRLCQEGKRLKVARKHREAAEKLRAAVEADPGLVEAHWVLAWVLIELRNQDGAAEEFQKVIELAPDSDLAKQAAQALERLGQ